MEEQEDAPVWDSFEKSVAYLKEVASIYENAFGTRTEMQRDVPPVSNKKSVTKAHLDEAHNQAQQALELLASNLLNASMMIINSIEKQESEADSLNQKISAIRKSIRDQQNALDQQATRQLYASCTIHR
ncbi:hypothetical protein PHYBOEH_005502 [Phytophthora boehmeriae]|uniref:Uncharacterized protein n=1 Tax=Phytophthora boehmeriae TaxID=109152 RepID=A0A8T1X571_9STRA|nr:hypothetical protein PHYBOEH_005502 [Phytophthora boehmeriae]